jgi:hypothetical protein
MKVGTIVNIMHVYGQYQDKIKYDREYLKYCIHTGGKFQIQKAQEQLDKDQSEMRHFLDYEV